MNLALWWIRRDLRLADNQALQAALQHSQAVVPLFILDPALEESPWYSARRMAFLLGGLRALDASLRERGSRLVVRRGEPGKILSQLCEENNIIAIHAEQDYSPYAKRRDAAIAKHLPLVLHNGVAARPVGVVRQDSGKAYTVFTPYSRRWQIQPTLTPADLLPAPQQIPTPTHIPTLELLPTLELPDLALERAVLSFVPGETEALRRLAAFVEGEHAPVYHYATARNRPDLTGTAQLSPYLRFGLLSARQAVICAEQAIHQAPTAEAQAGATSWRNELIWRDFYINILHEFPQVRHGSFRPAYDAIAWCNDPNDFAAWCDGRTGYPIVDAAMRQLFATGWMHNRLRMIVASFLVKDLLIDWRWGERWFMQQLVDGDPAANNGGWQWTAGVGTDAAPYFRVFNPVAQGEKFDPEGAFVRRWLPEIESVPTALIHAPWTLSKPDQIRARCVIGVDYPTPIVDHAWARQRVLAAYQAVKE